MARLVEGFKQVFQRMSASEQEEISKELEQEKDYTPCYIDEKSAELLLKEYNSEEKGKNSFETILLKANPPNPPDSESKVIEEWTKKISAEPAKVDSVLQLEPLAKDRYTMEALKVEPSTNKGPTFATAAIENDLDVIFAKIHINASKIHYLEAQLYMLNKFYSLGFQSLPEPAKKTIEENTINASKEKVLVPTPVLTMLEDLPCKLGEIKFLLKLLREAEDVRNGNGTKM